MRLSCFQTFCTSNTYPADQTWSPRDVLTAECHQELPKHLYGKLQDCPTRGPTACGGLILEIWETEARCAKMTWPRSYRKVVVEPGREHRHPDCLLSPPDQISILRQEENPGVLPLGSITACPASRKTVTPELPAGSGSHLMHLLA